MSRSGEQITGSVAAALAGADPDASWAAALAVLRQAGIQPVKDGAAPAFVIEYQAQRGRRKTLDARPRRHPEPFSPELAPSSTPAPSAPGAIAYLALAEEAIFSMLCTIVNSCHWAFTFRRPRNVKRRIPLF